MFKLIADTSDEIKNGGVAAVRMFKFWEEVGEFSVEAAIETGISNKTPGPDGVLGEAADVVITTLDIVHKIYPSLTEEEFIEVVKKKLAKWKSKTAVAKPEEQ